MWSKKGQCKILPPGGEKSRAWAQKKQSQNGEKSRAMRIGFGYDVHALAEGLDLVLGGVKIPSEVGCVAHSDGDVAIHALCDALLGAVALGDIGKLFPDNDPAYEGADSLKLLEHVVALLKEKCPELLAKNK